jgi:hypothetical protein
MEGGAESGGGGEDFIGGRRCGICLFPVFFGLSWFMNRERSGKRCGEIPVPLPVAWK